jgi:hypothetical protein
LVCSYKGPGASGLLVGAARTGHVRRGWLCSSLPFSATGRRGCLQFGGAHGARGRAIRDRVFENGPGGLQRRIRAAPGGKGTDGPARGGYGRHVRGQLGAWLLGTAQYAVQPPPRFDEPRLRRPPVRAQPVLPQQLLRIRGTRRPPGLDTRRGLASRHGRHGGSHLFHPRSQ